MLEEIYDVSGQQSRFAGVFGNTAPLACEVEDALKHLEFARFYRCRSRIVILEHSFEIQKEMEMFYSHFCDCESYSRREH